MTHLECVPSGKASLLSKVLIDEVKQKELILLPH